MQQLIDIIYKVLSKSQILIANGLDWKETIVIGLILTAIVLVVFLITRCIVSIIKILSKPLELLISIPMTLISGLAKGVAKMFSSEEKN